MTKRTYTHAEIDRASRVYSVVRQGDGVTPYDGFTAMAAALVSLDIDEHRSNYRRDHEGPAPTTDQILEWLRVDETVELEGKIYRRTDEAHVAVLGPVGEPILCYFDDLPF